MHASHSAPALAFAAILIVVIAGLHFAGMLAAVNYISA